MVAFHPNQPVSISQQQPFNAVFLTGVHQVARALSTAGWPSVSNAALGDIDY
jgi:hypothetical protein